MFLLCMFLVAGCSVNNSGLVKEYNSFGIKCAKEGLWDEAITRWERIVEIDPNNAKAHNNLGVAYESKGKFEASLAEYKTAIELDPDNKVYTRNYKRFKLNYERINKKKEQQEARLKTQDTGIESTTNGK